MARTGQAFFESNVICEYIEETQGAAPNYPMIGDTDFNVSKLYDMLPAEAGETSEGRTPAAPLLGRSAAVG